MRPIPRANAAATIAILAGAALSHAAHARPDGTLFPAVIPLASLDGTIGFRVDGVAESDNSGFSVASAGDVNGDGMDDFVIGAFRADPGGVSHAGSTYVVFGKDGASAGAFSPTLALASLNGANGFRLDGVAAGDQSGFSVAPAGDCNGDGVGDLIIGAGEASPGGVNRAGSTYVVFGKDTSMAGAFPPVLALASLNGESGFRLDGVAEGDYSGRSVASAGDVNGDGIDDLVIGAYNASPGGVFHAGSTYVVFGKNTASAGAFPATLALASLNGANGFRLDGVVEDERSGFSVASAGDVNGDGVDDLVTGAQSADPYGASNAGSTYIVFGKDTAVAGAFPPVLTLASLDGSNGFRLDGVANDDYSGRSVASAGDVNGDGVDDLVIGAEFADLGGANYTGSTYVVFGKDTAVAGAFPPVLALASLDGSNGFRLDGVAAGDHSGRSVASAGDVNGDGVDDLVIGAYRAAPGGVAYAGSTYVVFGKDAAVAGAFPPVLALASLDGSNGFRLDGVAVPDLSGFSVASAGDVNGDGIDDLVIGAYNASPGGVILAGSTYVVFGRGAQPPEIARSVVAAGGGASASLTIDSAADGAPAPMFMVLGTIGQHDASVSSGGGFEVRGGFWFAPQFAPPPPCEGDTNADNVVDFLDLNNILSSFGIAFGEPNFIPGADLNHDNVVDFIDLNIVLSFFGTSC